MDMLPVVISSALSLLVTIFVFKYQEGAKDGKLASKTQMNEILAPILKKLRGYLYNYKKFENDIEFKKAISETKEILDDNYTLYPFLLSDLFERFSNEDKYKEEAFNNFCEAFIEVYNKQSRLLTQPVISIKYRNKVSWYKSKSDKFWYNLYLYLKCAYVVVFSLASSFLIIMLILGIIIKIYTK